MAHGFGDSFPRSHWVEEKKRIGFPFNSVTNGNVNLITYELSMFEFSSMMGA